jgi:UDP-N-acetylglucosamine--N-acetylmuramyl-(pentapeptide) pyrophosphoryl-undecaprenol N-acetylglucosamine transferase
MESPLLIAFTGGGTGGHIYPGLAVAERLASLNPCRVMWLGSDAGIDRSIVEKAGLDFFGIPSGKLRRYFSLRNVSDVFRVAAGFFAARRLLKKYKPALLFSKGGFVSVPPCAAAFSLGIPVYAHESDFSPGLATRLNLRFTEKLFIPYEETRRFFPEAGRGKLEASGNPIRKAFFDAASRPGEAAARGRAFLGLPEGARVLLVLGGSQGSQEVNGLVAASLSRLTESYVVVHQTGNGFEGPASRNYLPFAYINDELPDVLAASELVVCRGGAGTLWEVAALGKPAVVIPLQGSGTRGDQVENARIFEERGAAISLASDPSAENLMAAVSALEADENKRKAMSLAGLKNADASGIIAAAIINRIERK